MTQTSSEKKPFLADSVQAEPQAQSNKPPPYELSEENHETQSLPLTNGYDRQPRSSGSRFKKIFLTVIFSFLIVGSFLRWGNRYMHRNSFHHYEHHEHHFSNGKGKTSHTSCREHMDKGAWGKAGCCKHASHSPPQPQAERLKSHHKQFPNLNTGTYPACNITRETFGRISGHFDLYDCLDIETAAGSVDIVITPHPGSEPAKLRIKTAAGSINVRVSDDFLDNVHHAHRHVRTGHDANDYSEVFSAIGRPVDAEITTAAGSITAKLPIGNGGRTLVSSASGHLDLYFMANNITPDDPFTELVTSTNAGSQKVMVVPMFARPLRPISNLMAEHTSYASASIDAYYTSEWEGSVDAEVFGSASLVVQGVDLVIDLDDGRHVKAHRGDGKGQVKITSMASGRVAFNGGR